MCADLGFFLTQERVFLLEPPTIFLCLLGLDQISDGPDLFPN